MLSGAKVLDQVHAFLGRFVAYPSKETHVAHALWIAHTHLMEAWESTPRIAFLSPEPGSGKTAPAAATHRICFRADQNTTRLAPAMALPSNR